MFLGKRNEITFHEIHGQETVIFACLTSKHFLRITLVLAVNIAVVRVNVRTLLPEAGVGLSKRPESWRPSPGQSCLRVVYTHSPGKVSSSQTNPATTRFPSQSERDPLSALCNPSTLAILTLHHMHQFHSTYTL